MVQRTSRAVDHEPQQDVLYAQSTAARQQEHIQLLKVFKLKIVLCDYYGVSCTKVLYIRILTKVLDPRIVSTRTDKTSDRSNLKLRDFNNTGFIYRAL